MAETHIQRLQRAYRQVFLTPNGMVPEGAQKLVLTDLMKFCSAAMPPTRRSKLPGDTKFATGPVDMLATMQVVGRQEVWQRMQAQLNLPIRDVTMMGLHNDEPMI